MSSEKIALPYSNIAFLKQLGKRYIVCFIIFYCCFIRTDADYSYRSDSAASTTAAFRAGK